MEIGETKLKMYNKKLKPLLYRLEEALNCITSDKETKKVYDLVGRYTRKVNKYSRDEFYSNLTQKTINPTYINGDIYFNQEYLENGKKIISNLENQISLPQTGEKNYWQKLNEVIDNEYKIISKYYGIKND